MIPIAHPLADEETAKAILECTLSIMEEGKLVNGIKECQKKILKNEISGLMVFNANTSPMDLITHIPILCEERNIPYVFVEKKEYLNGFTCVFLRSDLENESSKKVRKIVEKLKNK